jgi:hypothetical protein
MELRNQLKKLNKEKEDLRKQLDKTTGLFLERDQGLNNSAVARYDVDSDKFDEMYRRDIMEIKQSIDELKRNNQGLGNSQMLFPSQVNPHLYNDPRLLPSNVDPRDKANYEALNLKGQPLYNNQEMTRTDRANLLAHGVNGLVDVNGTNDKAIAHLNLKLEYEDHRKVSTFSVQFLSIKYIPIGDSTKIVGFSIPDSLFMTFDFFNSPMKKTKTLSYMNVSSEEMRLKPELYAHKQMILINQDFVRGKGTIKESIHQFEVNPAVEGSMAIHTKYIRYLAEKELHIDLWDGDSLMHFGKARVKLHNVLRQGKEIEIYTPTVEVFDEETKTIKASLQLTLKNQGTPVDQRVSAYPEEQEHFSFNKTSKGGKYKVKSLLPMDIEKELAGGFDGTRVLTNEEIEDEEKRKRLRVNRYKVLKSTLSKTAANKLNVSEVESFHNSLRDIEAIREKKKPEVINKAILKGFSEEHVVSTVFGETKLLSYKFQNMLQTQADYKLKVEVTNGLSPKEFRVVSHPEEWQSCVAKLKVERPPEWGMLETGQIFSLKAGESVTLIFKFLTYDENEISGKSAGKKVGNVSICDIGGSLIAGLSFQFRVAHPVIDRSISFHELESRNALLVLPPFFNSENTALNR